MVREGLAMANDGSRSDTRFYWRAWWIVRDLRVGLWPIRVSLLVSLLVVVILWIPDQARESLQVLVEDRASYGTPVWRTLICALFAALSLWYWSRNLIYVLPPDATSKAGKWSSKLGPPPLRPGPLRRPGRGLHRRQPSNSSAASQPKPACSAPRPPASGSASS